uniref:Uncharacterized protein n=1 Tax=Arundo donax TaxID=35708 RepID=A0A0A8YYM4_ARUDO
MCSYPRSPNLFCHPIVLVFGNMIVMSTR